MADTTATTNPRVLIVDDDATMRLLMRHTLKKAAFEVEEAIDGEPAVEMVKQQAPDIILLDVMMPNMDGFTTCAEIRKLPGGEHIPILLVTGLDDMDSINKAYEAGATDFITKPITFPLLSHRVRYVLRASSAIENVGKSEARLAHAQSIAHLGNWEWDLSQDEVFWSDEVFRILGLNKEQTSVCMGAYENTIHRKDQILVKNMLEKARSGESLNFDHRIIRSIDGAERIVHIQCEAMYDDAEGGGNTYQINGTIQDITERKQVENELKQYRNHLEELVEQRTTELTEANTQLLDAKEQAEQANDLKDKFVSLVAHDLRSPLAGIISALEFLHTDDETPLNEEHKDIVGRLLEIGKSLVQMIEDVLNIGRLKTGKIATKRALIDAHDTIDNVLNNLSYLARQKGVNIVNDVPPNQPLYADPALYGEVIQNLASNGIKFCNKGDSIRFYMPEGQPTVIAIQDSGVGIPEEHLPKLFKIEEKTSTPGTSGEKGTGFGLPFSQDIMHAHDGKLSVTSVLGEGTTFFVHLPEETPASPTE